MDRIKIRSYAYVLLLLLFLSVRSLAAITSLNEYVESVKQNLTWTKTTTRTTVTNTNFSVFDIAGNPGAGTLSAGNTANGIVPTDLLAGYPVIAPFAGGATGYVSRVLYGSSVPCRLTIFDRVFSAGAYAYNADVTLTSQPSFVARLPGGTYGNLELWVEAVTAFTGTPSVRINYLNQDGNAGDTGVVATPAALTLGRCYQMPLASGDYGIQQITRVRGTVATAGTFNVNILRRLWTGRVPIACAGDVHNLAKTGLPQVFADSALYVLIATDGTTTGYPEMQIEIASR